MKPLSARQLTLPFIITSLCAGITGCNQAQHARSNIIELNAVNPLSTDVANAPIKISLQQLTASNSQVNEQWVLTQGNSTISQQWIDTDADGKVDHLLAITDFNANESKALILSSNKVKVAKDTAQRVNVELAIKQNAELVDGIYQGGEFNSIDKVIVPSEHKVGDQLYRFEGLGWESELVGYRLYLDHRNTADIFGKKQTDMVLARVGESGSNYHKPADWGMDILKVGPSLGMGSIGYIEEGKAQRISSARVIDATISQDGPIHAIAQVRHLGANYQQTPFHLTSQYSINAGSRLTWHQASIEGASLPLVAGIVKHQNTELLSSNTNKPWAYIASYGPQSEAKDALGMVMFYQTSEVQKAAEDDFNYLIVFKNKLQKVNYAFAAVWQQDSSGLTSKSQFEQWLNHELDKLNNPIEIRVR